MFARRLRQPRPSRLVWLPLRPNAAPPPNPRPYSSRFFAPNKSPPAEPHHPRRPPPGRAEFLNPSHFYPPIEISSDSILKDATQQSPRPAEWDTIFAAQPAPVSVGTFVEFIHDGGIQFGAVLREPASKFNPYHNRMVVLTIDNELVRVHAQDITFCAPVGLRSAAAQAEDILAHRFDDLHSSRVQMVRVLHQFVRLAFDNKKQTALHLQAVHSNVAASDAMAPVSLAATVLRVASLCGAEMPSRFHQCAFAMRVYLAMCRDPSRWMVPGCVPSERALNVSVFHSSNALPPVATFFAIPLSTMGDIAEVLHYNHDVLAELDKYLGSLLATPKLREGILLDVTVWSGRKFRPAFSAMLFALVYPHQELLAKFLSLSALGQPVTRGSLQQFLRTLGIFDSPGADLADPWLSSGLLGRVKQNLLAATTQTDLAASSIHLAARSEEASGGFWDKYQHLRRTRKYFHDHTAFVLPGLSRLLAVSMEKINSRRFRLNVHVPDIASRVSPSSATFLEWSNSTTRLMSKLDHKLAFHADASPFKRFLFKERLPATSHFLGVGDISKPPFRPEGESFNCITLSFEYNSSLLDPMKKMGEFVSITFDTLTESQLHYIDSATMEKSLTGKLEPSIFGKLKLFSQTGSSHSQDEPKLNSAQHHDVNFIYNFLVRHFQWRNRNQAINVDPVRFCKAPQKSHSVDRENDSIHTDLLVMSPAAAFPKTDFFRRETSLFAQNLAASFCQWNGIAVFCRSQQVLGTSGDEHDGVLIKHDNVLLPDFTAQNYGQVAFARDVSGHISTPAFLFACNHVEDEKLSADKSVHVTKGLLSGSVDIVNAAFSMEAYLNQIQILAHAHFTQTAQVPFFDKPGHFSRLKALGYSLHGPLDAGKITRHCENLSAAALGAKYAAARQKKYWLLRAIEENPEKYTGLRCVVTKYAKGSDIEPLPLPGGASDGPLAEFSQIRVYCESLGVEADYVGVLGSGTTVGSDLEALGVLYVDAISSQLVLG